MLIFRAFWLVLNVIQSASEILFEAKPGFYTLGGVTIFTCFGQQHGTV